MVSTPALSQQHGLPILHGARVEMVWKFVKIHPSHSLLSCDACTPNSKLLEARELEQASRSTYAAVLLAGLRVSPCKVRDHVPFALGKMPRLGWQRAGTLG